MRFIKLLFMGGLSLVSLASQAETVKGLYQVREPVSSQAPEERDQATQRALDTLVLRLTGDPKAAQSPGLAALRKDPQQIISQYGFDAGPPEVLKVDFDPAATGQALRRAGLSLWGANRPSILGWWLNDATEGSSLVGDGQASAVPLRRAAQHRGLPLRLPLADLNEQIVATAPNLESADPAPLRGASGRYNADALLAVHAREEGGSGRPSGVCGWAIRKKPAVCRARIRPPLPMRSCWRSISVWHHGLWSSRVLRANNCWKCRA